jgi:hypothetical protein
VPTTEAIIATGVSIFLKKSFVQSDLVIIEGAIDAHFAGFNGARSLYHGSGI